MIAFCDKTTRFGDEKRAIDIVYFLLQQGLPQYPHTKIAHHGLDEWTARLVKSCLDNQI